MTSSSETSLLLNFYENENMEEVWCWKNQDTGEASQEFSSEGNALDAWRHGNLTWSRLEDLGN